MLKKSFKWIAFSLISLLLVSFAFVFVGCSNKEDNTNNAHPANSIPNSNVFDDIANYIQQNGEKQGTPPFECYSISMFNSAKKQFLLQYQEDDHSLRLKGVVSDSNNNTMEFITIIPDLKDNEFFNDYSKVPYTFALTLSNPKVVAQLNIQAKEYVDMHTTTPLPNFSMVLGSLTKEEKEQLHSQFSKCVAQLLNEFNNFYANTIKKNTQYIGATYKYFHLPVVQ